MMKRITKKNFYILAPLLFVALLLAATPAWSADNLAEKMSHRLGKKETPKEAIEKVGFFGGVENGRVKIKDQNTYKQRTYLVAPDMIVTHQEQEFELIKIRPDSIVELIIVDAEVIEIILIEGSS